MSSTVSRVPVSAWSMCGSPAVGPILSGADVGTSAGPLGPAGRRALRVAVSLAQPRLPAQFRRKCGPGPAVGLPTAVEAFKQR